MLVTAQRILDASPSAVHVVPLTSTLRSFNSEVLIAADPGNGLEADSAAQCQHLRAVSVARITGSRGSVGAVLLTQIREKIAVLLDLPD